MGSGLFSARSLLFVPGDSERKMEKAAASAADMLLLDLEDAVAEPTKPTARGLVRAFLGGWGGGNRPWVRINALDTEHALPDLAAIVGGRPGGVMLPKVRSRGDIERLDNYLTALEAASHIPLGSVRVIIVSTETPEGLFAIGTYRDAPRLEAMTWGAEDIATAIGALDNRDDTGEYEHFYQMARSLCLAGAAAAHVVPIETIHGNFRDPEGLKRTATLARRAGFRGMLSIHPDQVDVINAAFTPTAEEVARARRIVDLFAANPGVGVLGLDGEMLDVPHLRRAQDTVALADRLAGK